MRDSLTRLLVALETGRMPDDLARWLQDGIHEYRLFAGNVPLCECLGLNPREARNKLLREAFKHVALGDLKDWPRAQRLCSVINRFETVTWRRVEHLSEPPEHFDPLKRALFHAMKTGAKMPESPRHILRIVLDKN